MLRRVTSSSPSPPPHRRVTSCSPSPPTHRRVTSSSPPSPPHTASESPGPWAGPPLLQPQGRSCSTQPPQLASASRESCRRPSCRQPLMHPVQRLPLPCRLCSKLLPPLWPPRACSKENYGRIYIRVSVAESGYAELREELGLVRESLFLPSTTENPQHTAEGAH